MKMLILEGPDNLGKTTTMTKLAEILRGKSLKVHTIQMPDRSAWTKELEQYVMGGSDALPIERQYLIALNCMTQFAGVPRDVDVVICDRHPAVSNLVYFRDVSPAANMYRAAIQAATLNAAFLLGIRYMCCILLVGDQPFCGAEHTEHFEVSDKWHAIKQRYNRLKYTDSLPNCGIEVCAVDAWNCKEKTVEVVAGLFLYALQHGSLPQPLDKGILLPESEGEDPSSEVSSPEWGCPERSEGCRPEACAPCKTPRVHCY